jgi:hypothetical protein
MHPSRWMLLGVLSLSMLVTVGGMAPAASDDPYEKWLAQANEAMESMMLETGRRHLDAHTRIANQ